MGLRRQGTLTATAGHSVAAPLWPKSCANAFIKWKDPVRRILLVYHFFHPDDVVSARQFSDLATGLVARGWKVTVLTSARSCWDPQVTYPRRQTWCGVDVVRVMRPNWSQSQPISRLANSLYLGLA